MEQVVSGRWCTRVLVTSTLTCPRVLVPIVGLNPPDLVGPLLRHHHHHRVITRSEKMGTEASIRVPRMFKSHV
jgi:hypothetical protein